MLSKSLVRATILGLTLFAGACSHMIRTPWRDEPIRNEVNLAFTLERNLIQLPSLRIDNRAGRFILGTASQRTIVDTAFPLTASAAHALQMGDRETVKIQPQRIDLAGVADAIVGVEAWRTHAITIDYRVGLVSYQKDGIKPAYMQLYSFSGEPMINLDVDGRTLSAIVDTTVPDTLILPGATGTRGRAHVTIGATDFGAIDIGYGDVARPRIGNRLLSRFLVSIDYGRRVVGLWRDPRIPL
jgi:hypothetical protein